MNTSTRYSAPRICIQWEKNARLKILKMLAWKIYIDENIASPTRLEARIAVLYPMVTDLILGESVTLDAVRAQTLAEQGPGREITPAKLMQRADKTERYDEFNEFVSSRGRLQSPRDTAACVIGSPYGRQITYCFPIWVVLRCFAVG